MKKSGLGKKKKITKRNILSVLVKENPKMAEYLIKRYGLHCIGCPVAAMETLEEGLVVHGFSGEEIDSIVGELNELVD